MTRDPFEPGAGLRAAEPAPPQLQHLLEEAAQPAALIDAQGHLVAANVALAQLLRQRHAELQGRTLGAFDMQWCPRHWRLVWRRLCGGATLTLERALRAREPMMITADIRLSRFDVAGRPLALALVRQTGRGAQSAAAGSGEAVQATRRRRVQLVLARRVREFRTLAENSPDNIARYDHEGRLLYANPAVAQAWGVSVPAVVGMRPSQLAPTPHHWLHRFEPMVDAVLASGLGSEVEMSGSHADGTLHTYDVRFVAERERSGAIAGVLVIARDISERKRSEQALDRRKQEFRTLAENSPDFIARHDRDGRRAYANPALAQLLGGAVGDAAWTDDAAQLQAWVAEVVASGTMRRGELRYRRLDGTGGWLDLRLCPESDDEGHVASVLVIARDVSAAVAQREELELQVRRRTADLEAASIKANAANQAKSEFLAVMSHEIRTPLNGVLGMTELLSTTRLDANQQRLVEAARLSGRHLLALVNDVLDLAKIEANELRIENEPLDLAQLAQEAAAPFMAAAATKGLALRIELAPEQPHRVRGDALRLRQILVNLLGNAVKFTPAGQVALHIGAASQGRVCFEVSDSGIGIKADALPHVFDAFTQGDSSTARHYGGTGLGLAISSRLVRLMGGSIAADSEPGRGSTFRFTLTLDAEPAAAATAPGLATAAAPAPAQVLVVEDSEVNLEVACAMLRHHGFEPEVARDGHEALERVAARAYRLVFMDCMMPGIDGYETVRRLRRLERELGRERPVTIVALTANVAAGDLQRCRDAGMDDFVAKPVSLQAIGEVMARWA